MPKPLNLRASNAHRIACLTLYRALLRQSSALTAKLLHHEAGSSTPSCAASASSESTLHSLIRYRFHHDRALQSPRQIVWGIQFGHTALDLLHAASTHFSPTVLSQLSTLLTSTLNRASETATFRDIVSAARSPTHPSKSAKLAHLRGVADKARHTRHPASKPILARPLPLAEIRGGKRRVPYLVSAQGVPFLRYGRGSRQSIALTRMLRQRIRWQTNKWDQRGELEVGAALGRWEDEWDVLVDGHGRAPVRGQHQQQRRGREAGGEGIRGSQADREDEPSWTTEVLRSERDIHLQIQADDLKHAEMGRRMWAVVVKERELAEKEKREAKEQRMREREEKKKDRRGGCDNDSS